MVVGIAIRLYLAAGLNGKSWNDAAIVGLMAIHELTGKFYAFYWGQSYMGSLESLSIAPFFAIFGVSDLALYLGLLPWYILFTVALYFVTRRCGGTRAAAIAVLLCAVGSPYLQYHELMPIGGYPETVALGTVLLWLTFRIVYDPLSERTRLLHWLGLGLISGLAFWTNWLILPYFVVIGVFLLLDDWRAPFKRLGGIALAAFLAGSLPFWLFNMRHRFATFDLLGRQARLHDARYAIRWGDIFWVLDAGFKRVLGLDGDFTSARLGEAIYLVAAVAVLIAIFALKGSWMELLRGNAREASPTTALFLLGTFTIVIYAECRPTTLQLERFLMPMTSVTLPLAALGVAWIAERSKVIGTLVLVALLGFYAAQITAMHSHFAAPVPRFWAGQVDGLAAYLLRSPIRSAYADYGDAAITTYLTKDRVVVADYKEWRYPLDEVDFRDPAVLVRDDELPAEGTLASLNARFSKTPIPGYTVYWPIRYDGVPRAPLPRSGWKLTANVSPDNAPLILDGDPLTRWNVAARGSVPSLSLDLGREETVTGLYFGLGDRAKEGFRKLRIDTSRDGERWEYFRMAEWDFPMSFRGNGQITTVPDNIQLVLFPSISTRWLRMSLVGDTFDHYWTVAELGVFGLSKNDTLFQLPEADDPFSPPLLESRLKLEDAREPRSNHALLALRMLYQSTGNRNAATEVERMASERFSPNVRVGWNFGGELTLLGYDWRETAGREVEITYYWKADRKMSADYAVSAHFKGTRCAFQDDYVLGAPVDLTSTWEPGDILKEVRRIVLPAQAGDGSCSLLLGVWDPNTRRALRLGGWWLGPRQASLLKFIVNDGRVERADQHVG
jgi:hypothetical protein